MPIQVNYRAADVGAMFIEKGGDANQSFKLANLATPGRREIVVVPQREGRSFITVTAELQTPAGIQSYSRDIAINVGAVPIQKTLNGELKADENGEPIISMPAN